MSGDSGPDAARRSKRVAPTGLTERGPSLRTAVIVFIAVLILFRWLHLILTLEIASTSHQIENLREERRRHERIIADLRRRIAVAESPDVLSDMADEMGYGMRPVVYLPLDRPLVPLTDDDSADAFETSDQETRQDAVGGHWAAWGAVLGTWEEMGSVP